MSTESLEAKTPTQEARRPGAGSRLRRQLVSQFHRPHGTLGHLAGFVLARRPSNRRRNRWTVELLDVAPGHRVLELGFGPGLALAACLERTTRGRPAADAGGQVVGVDHSATMCAAAGRRNRAALRAGRLVLHEACFDALPDLGAPFDRIFAVNAAFFSHDPDALLADLVARLRPGGRIALTFQPRTPGATREDALQSGRETTAAFERAGLGALRTEVLPLEPVPAVCVLGERGAAR